MNASPGVMNDKSYVHRRNRSISTLVQSLDISSPCDALFASSGLQGDEYKRAGDLRNDTHDDLLPFVETPLLQSLGALGEQYVLGESPLSAASTGSRGSSALSPFPLPTPRSDSSMRRSPLAPVFEHGGAFDMYPLVSAGDADASPAALVFDSPRPPSRQPGPVSPILSSDPGMMLETHPAVALSPVASSPGSHAAFSQTSNEQAQALAFAALAADPTESSLFRSANLLLRRRQSEPASLDTRAFNHLTPPQPLQPPISSGSSLSLMGVPSLNALDASRGPASRDALFETMFNADRQAMRRASDSQSHFLSQNQLVGAFNVPAGGAAQHVRRASMPHGAASLQRFAAAAAAAASAVVPLADLPHLTSPVSAVGNGSVPPEIILISQQTPCPFSPPTNEVKPSRSGRNPYRRRSKASDEQLRVLKSAFAVCPIPDLGTRRYLAHHCGMTERSVQIWFQNHRAKQKQTAAGKFSQRASVMLQPPRGLRDAPPPGLSTSPMHSGFAAFPSMLSSPTAPVPQRIGGFSGGSLVDGGIIGPGMGEKTDIFMPFGTNLTMIPSYSEQ